MLKSVGTDPLTAKIEAAGVDVKSGITGWPTADEVPDYPVLKVRLKPAKETSKLPTLQYHLQGVDMELLAQQAAEEQDLALVEYLKEMWKVEVNPVNSLTEVTYRTKELLEKKKVQPDYWLNRRGRELYAERTGLFSDVRNPYETINHVELETDELVFNNLTDQLKIDSAPWFRMKFEKEEEERKRNAPLPRLPRNKLRKPNFTHGRIRKGAGGTLAMDKFVRTGELFQKGIRGSMTFTKLLENWRLEKEEEELNRGSEFGNLKMRRPTSASKKAADATAETAVAADANAPAAEPEVKSKPSKAKKPASTRRRSSIPEDKGFQFEMMMLERMMEAMYDILKSLLNMTKEQTRGRVRLPPSVVLGLRAHSPETRIRIKRTPPTEIMKRAKFAASIYTALPSAYSMKGVKSRRSKSTAALDMMPQRIERSVVSLSMLPEDLAIGLQYEGTGRIRPAVFDEEAIGQILPDQLTEPPEGVPGGLTRVHNVVYSATYLDDRPPMLKSVTLKQEAPEVTLGRLQKNENRFKSIFWPHKTEPQPPWHDVQVEDVLDTAVTSTTDSSTFRRKSFSAMEFVKERDTSTLPYTDKNPHPDDIPTPKLPGPPSVVRIESGELSRLRLLSKTPGADQDIRPTTPFRRLYKEAGVKNLETDLYKIIMRMKMPFRNVERKVRVYYSNEIDKYEWDTLKRYRVKIDAIQPHPVYEWSIGLMRQAMKEPEADELDIDGEKRPAMWYRNLVERCEIVGAMKHLGCEHMVQKLHKYCDVDLKTRPLMLNRLCLLVLSLPPTELGTPYFQDAIAFFLDRLFGAPKELLHQWLKDRSLPLLV